MKTTLRIAALPVLFAMILTACSKNDDEPVKPAEPTVLAVTATNIDGDVAKTDKYTLFSLADNKVIPNTDSASAKWDIGFKGTTIIINGGTSGPGAGSAQVVSGVFNDLSEAPESGYAADGATLAVSGWYSYNMDTHIISPVTGKFIVLKTATGKYAKLEIYSYYKDAPASPTLTSPSRYFNFRYQLQANGTRSFK